MIRRSDNRKCTLHKVSIGIMGFCLFGLAQAQSVTLDGLEVLIQGGVDDATIIARIDSSPSIQGLDDQGLVRLSQAGASKEVLAALIRAMSGSPKVSDSSSSQSHPAVPLLKEGQFEATVDLVEQRIANRQAGGMDYFAATIALLMLEDYSGADDHLASLEGRNDQESNQLFEKAVRFKEKLVEQQMLLDELVYALSSFDQVKIDEIVTSDKFSESRQNLLAVNASLLQGHWSQAESTIENIQNYSRRSQLTRRYSERREQYESAYSQLKELYDVRGMLCSHENFYSSKEPPIPDVEINDVATVISTLSSLVPFSSELAHYFAHWALFSTSYEEYSSYALSIMKAQGFLRVPSNDNHARYDLIIDLANRKLFVDDITDEHPIFWYDSPYTGIGGRDGSTIEHSLTSIGFDEIESLSQRLFVGINDKHRAVTINKKIQSPEWRLMEWVKCDYGAATMVQGSRNLLRLIAEVANVPESKVKYEKKDGRGSIFSATVGAIALTALQQDAGSYSSPDEFLANIETAQNAVEEHETSEFSKRNQWKSLILEDGIGVVHIGEIEDLLLGL